MISVALTGNVAAGKSAVAERWATMGVPVVCSDVASGGVDAEPGSHLLTATEAEDYADAVLRVLDDTAVRSQLARDGRDRVLRRHNWQNSMQRLDTIIARATADVEESR